MTKTPNLTTTPKQAPKKRLAKTYTKVALSRPIGFWREPTLDYPGKGCEKEKIIASFGDFLKEQPEAIAISEYLEYYGMPQRRLNEYVNRWPELKEAYEDFKIILAGRRHVGACRFKYSAFVYKDIYAYDSAWLKYLLNEAVLRGIKQGDDPEMVIEQVQARYKAMSERFLGEKVKVIGEDEYVDTMVKGKVIPHEQ
jgi:hypothetical protein